MATEGFRLPKAERISGRRQDERLFTGSSRSMSAFPIRAVYLLEDRGEGVPTVRIMTSVSKRHFKHAVERNRVKRQLREAYRLNKSLIVNGVEALGDKSLMLAFLWLDDKIWATEDVEKRVVKLLQRIAERLRTKPDK